MDTTSLTERFWAKVDKSGECWEWTASRKPRGYGQINAGRRGSKGGMLLAHRVSWEISNGPIPEGMAVDHKCHNRGCVNPDHLRVVTPKQNQENRSESNRPTPRGVSWNKALRKWEAGVMHDGKKTRVGLFLTIEEAASAALAKRNELFTHNDLDRQAS